jgi:hypothetical protein
MLIIIVVTSITLFIIIVIIIIIIIIRIYLKKRLKFSKSTSPISEPDIVVQRKKRATNDLLSVIALKLLNYLAFQSFDLSRLLQKHVMRTKSDIYVFIVNR